MRNRTLLLPALLAVLLTVSATAAQAGEFVLVLRDVTGGTINDEVIIADNGGFDEDGTGALDAIVSLSTIVGNFEVTVFGTTFNLGGPTIPGGPVQMNLSNFLVTSTSGGTFTAELTRTGVAASLFGPSVWGITQYGANFFDGKGTVQFQSWINGVSVLDASTSDTLDPPPPPVYGGPVALAGDFSMVSKLTFDVSANAALQADTALQVESVPEPTTLLLFGPGMLGLAALRRRLRSKAL